MDLNTLWVDPQSDGEIGDVVGAVIAEIMVRTGLHAANWVLFRNDGTAITGACTTEETRAELVKLSMKVDSAIYSAADLPPRDPMDLPGSLGMH